MAITVNITSTICHEPTYLAGAVCGGVTFGAGKSGCSPTYLAGAGTCAGAVFSDGVQEGCTSTISASPVVQTAFLSPVAGGIVLGGTGALTANIQTLDDFLPPGLRVLLYIDGVTAKGSMIPLTAGNTATGEGTAQAYYAGPAVLAMTGTFAGIGNNRPWFGSNTADWRFAGSVTNDPQHNNARFEVLGRFDPRFTAANSGFSLVIITLAQYLAFNDASRQLGALFVCPSPYFYNSVHSAYMGFGQDFFFTNNAKMVARVREPGASFIGVDLAGAVQANAQTSFLANWGPSAFAYGCVVPTTATQDNQLYGQFDWFINQTAGNVLNPISTNNSDLLPSRTAVLVNYTAQPLITWGATENIGASIGQGSPNTARWGIWLLVEGQMSTAQITTFVSAALSGYRMKGATP